MPFWLEALERFRAEPLVVIPVRNPLDVTESLRKRDKIDPAFGYLMWLQHALSAEMSSRGVRRIHLRYEQLLYQPRVVTDRLRSALGNTLPQCISDVDAKIDEFLSPNLHHNRSKDEDILENPQIHHWVRSSFEILDRWANDKETRADITSLTRIKENFDEAMQVFDPALGLGFSSTREAWQAQEVSKRLQAELSRVLDSKSWRIIRSLRKIRRNLISLIPFA